MHNSLYDFTREEKEALVIEHGFNLETVTKIYQLARNYIGLKFADGSLTTVQVKPRR